MISDQAHLFKPLSSSYTSETMAEEFYIPVTPYIEDFKLHLRSHERSILSARFGDGKSYFLQKLKESDEANREFLFLTIYPVNYQVLGNRDIFDLVKRDVLLQMIVNDMIEPDYEVSDAVAVSYYLMTHAEPVIKKLVPFVSRFFDGLDPSYALNGFKATSLLKRLKEKVDKLKNEGSDESAIEAFCKKTDNIATIECDAVSMIIRECLDLWRKKNSGKKVVLVVEDMDRIDPAHLFRIMNILSAHMDYGYKWGVNTNDSLAGNKFGFDNVVLVLDYDNIRKIFHHFYGPDTDFNGYIHKFCSQGHYRYSLADNRLNYYYDEISRVTGLDLDFVKMFFPVDHVNQYELRRMKDSLKDLDLQIKEKAKFYNESLGKKCIASLHLLRGLILQRRLDRADDEINQSLTSILLEYPVYMKYMLLAVYASGRTTSCSLRLKIGVDDVIIVCFDGIDDEGDANITIQSAYRYGGGNIKMADLVAPLLNYISP